MEEYEALKEEIDALNSELITREPEIGSPKT